MKRKVLIIFTPSEDIAKSVVERLDEKSIEHILFNTILVLMTEKDESFLKLVSELEESLIGNLRFLLLDSAENLKIDERFLLSQVPSTMDMKGLIDVLINKLLGSILYETKVFFHAIVDLKDGSVFAFESLCRPPLSIVDLLKVGKSSSMFFENFCRGKALKEASQKVKGLKLFLNIHPGFLTDPLRDFGDLISTAISYNFDPSSIVLELTEHERIDLKSIKNLINFLKEEGVKVALDDVGSGYSGLFYLHELKPDYIKIDMELIRDIHKNNFKKVIVSHLIEMAHWQNIKVVCEGVEKEEELEWIVYAGSDYAQGFLFSKPIEKPKLEEIEERSKRLIRSLTSSN